MNKLYLWILIKTRNESNLNSPRKNNIKLNFAF